MLGSAEQTYLLMWRHLHYHRQCKDNRCLESVPSTLNMLYIQQKKMCSIVTIDSWICTHTMIYFGGFQILKILQDRLGNQEDAFLSSSHICLTLFVKVRQLPRKQHSVLRLLKCELLQSARCIRSRFLGRDKESLVDITYHPTNLPPAKHQAHHALLSHSHSLQPQNTAASRMWDDCLVNNLPL